VVPDDVLLDARVQLPRVTGASLRNPIGAIMAIRRRLFTSVGGFSSRIGRIGIVPLGCEETELCTPLHDSLFGTTPTRVAGLNPLHAGALVGHRPRLAAEIYAAASSPSSAFFNSLLVSCQPIPLRK
jgi:hypothetical protein